MIMTIFQTKACLIAKERVTKDQYKLSLGQCEEIAHHSQPGQFLHILCQTEQSFAYKTIGQPQELKDRMLGKLLILRRPFSIHRVYKRSRQTQGPSMIQTDGVVDAERLSSLCCRALNPEPQSPEAAIVEILFKVVGKGTQLLSQKEIGEELDVIGPIGQGFKIRSEMKNAIIVAGGIGIAPLYGLAEELNRQGKNVYLLYGALDKASIPVSFDHLRAEVRIATAERSNGLYHGLVTEMLSDFLDKYQHLPNKEVFSCGPKAMLKEVAKITSVQSIPCQVSLEERMACGIGACMGCVCRTYGTGYSRVCVDGPVFNANEVIWI